MKKIFSIVITFLFASCAPTYHTTVVAPNNPPVQAPPPQEETSYQVFYNELSPYGRWIDYPGEGYVWAPNADPGFQPYSTNGHWVYTNQGWTWVSNYNWGWAPFHYGRWFYENGYGWLWVPGHEWAPAWVTWGRSGNYYGWAPLAPHITVNQEWTPPQQSWVFVPAEHITKPNISQYVVDRSINTSIVKNITIIKNTTTVINNNAVNNNITNNTNIVNNNTTNNINNNHVVTNNTIVINKGPKITQVQKVANIHIEKATIIENNKPAPTKTVNNTLVMYKPVIVENVMQKNGNKAAPQKTEQYNRVNTPK